jgi:hypothetical protein
MAWRKLLWFNEALEGRTALSSHVQPFNLKKLFNVTLNPIPSGEASVFAVLRRDKPGQTKSRLIKVRKG